MSKGEDVAPSRWNDDDDDGNGADAEGECLVIINNAGYKRGIRCESIFSIESKYILMHKYTVH